MRWCLAFGVLLACAGDGNDDRADTSDTTASTTLSGSESTESETGAGTSTESTDDTGTTDSTTDAESSSESAADTSSDEGVDCDAPADCEACWICARDGACAGAYEACANDAFCIPSLTCVGSMCTPDGLMQSCADTCCKSCTMLGTCQAVDAAISCIEQQCAQLCGDVSCP